MTDLERRRERKCLRCWWSEGSRCYKEPAFGPLNRDDTGRTPLITHARMDECDRMIAEKAVARTRMNDAQEAVNKAQARLDDAVATRNDIISAFARAWHGQKL